MILSCLIFLILVLHSHGQIREQWASLLGNWTEFWQILAGFSISVIFLLNLWLLSFQITVLEGCKAATQYLEGDPSNSSTSWPSKGISCQLLKRAGPLLHHIAL